jgi:putative Holliday junction resolvase
MFISFCYEWGRKNNPSVIAPNMPTRNPLDLPASGKLAALDVGEKTVGLAVSDGLRLVANPRHTLRRTVWKDDKKTLAAFFADEGVVAVVVGLPLHLSGDQSPSSQAATAYAENIEKDLGLPALLWDERLTTAAAERALFEQRQGRQTRASRKDVKAHIDAVAAALILQGVLDRLRQPGT